MLYNASRMPAKAEFIKPAETTRFAFPEISASYVSHGVLMNSSNLP
jgi:hypothetical protein